MRIPTPKPIKFFTIGHTESYNRGLITLNKGLMKQGMRGDYLGGIVFDDPEVAEQHIMDHFSYNLYSVYGLLTTRDNIHSWNGKFGHIKNDCQIVSILLTEVELFKLKKENKELTIVVAGILDCLKYIIRHGSDDAVAKEKHDYAEKKFRRDFLGETVKKDDNYD